MARKTNGKRTMLNDTQQHLLNQCAVTYVKWADMTGNNRGVNTPDNILTLALSDYLYSIEQRYLAAANLRLRESLSVSEKTNELEERPE